MIQLKKWYAARGPKFLYQRGTRLLDRYNLSSDKAMRRIDSCVATLAKFDCAPTLPTPAVIVQRYPHFIRHLQDAGAEIAVHGYQHVDLNASRLEEALEQLKRAARTFEKLGIEVHGFRCPYLSCSEQLLNSLPEGLFCYSSNKAIRMDLANFKDVGSGSVYYNTLDKFYQATSAADTVCIPWTRPNLVEIPVCAPDDLQLYDGLHLGAAGIAQAWKHMLHQIHKRGELFTLFFHPELAALIEEPFEELLSEAGQLHPPVWIARLRDISDWWQEKSRFRVEVVPTSTALRISFECSPRATILARGLGPNGSEQIWDGAYYRLQPEPIEVPDQPRPFVGLPVGTPEHVLSFLQEQGYILDTGETAPQCGIFLDSNTLDSLANQVHLIDHIEASTAPLVRYWRWPEGARSALSVTGDLDALSLLDYASRFVLR